MAKLLSRRKLITRTALGGIALASLGRGRRGLAQGALELQIGTLTGGWTQIAHQLMLEHGFDRKHGLAFKNTNYNSVQQYYAAFASGQMELGTAAWDGLAKLYLRGVPVQLVGTIATASMMAFIARDGGPRTLADLRGKRLAAVQASGVYSAARVVAKLYDGIDFTTEVTVQNAPNPPSTITLLAAGQVDAALAWEHSVSAALLRIGGSRVFVNVGEHYTAKTGRQLPYMTVALLKSAGGARPPGTVGRIAAAYDDLFRWTHANEDAFAERAKALEIDPAIIKTALASRRMQFAMRPFSVAANQTDMRAAAELLVGVGELPRVPDDGFLAV